MEKEKRKKVTCCKSTVSGNVTKPDKRALCCTMEGYYKNRNRILLAKCEISDITKEGRSAPAVRIS